MTRREQAGFGRYGLWEELLAAPDEEWLDLQELSSIVALPDFRRLMRAVCLRLGQLVNTSRLLMTSWAPAPAISNTSSTRSMACSTSAATTGPSTRRPPQPTSRMTALRLKRPHVATLDQVRISRAMTDEEILDCFPNRDTYRDIMSR